MEGITRTSLAAAGTSPPAMVALEYGSGRAVFGPMNGLTQPWGKGTNGYAYYNRNRSNALLLSTAAWLANGGADADGDGLTDMKERSGFLTQFGYRVWTDPMEVDTDGDGLPDPYELGEFVDSGVPGEADYWRIASDPSLNDTDYDGLEDFVELIWFAEGEEGLPSLDPFDPDCDDDGLQDGEEVDVYGTDPLTVDTDCDGMGDGDEVLMLDDPLLCTERTDVLVATHEFALGLVCGEWLMGDPEHGNMPYFSGLLSGGAVSVIPGPGWVVGIVLDARDLLAAFASGDWANIGLNSLALLPYVGDAADILGTTARFLVKHPEAASGAAVMLARWDWLPETTRLAGLVKTWGDDVIRGLVEKGFNEAKMLKMTRAGIDLKVINERLAPLFEDYPGIESFFRHAKAFEIDDSTVLLKGRTNTIDLKALGTTQNPHEITRILLTIKSGYTQILMEQKCVDEGWNILSNAKRFNSPGYDLVAEKDGVIKLMEAKSGNALSWDNFENYFHRHSYSDTNAFSFNRKYFMKNSGYEESEVIREAYKWGKIKIEVFVNNPQSNEIVKHLFDEVYLNSGEPFSAYYKNLNNAPRHVEVTFTAVHQ